MSSFSGIGLMSGNSLDGLDMCHVEFIGNPNVDVWSYRIIKTDTVPYSSRLRDKLRNVHKLSGFDLMTLHHEYGRFVGKETAAFIERENLTPRFVASQGHSAFHQPDKGVTFNLGDGETIAAYLPCPLVTSFKNKDVELGGQGRPLIALGDMYLFRNYDFCLNLGGIAFMSSHGHAFDICPCNVMLNYLTRLQNSGQEFDSDGAIAASGHVIPSLLKQLNELPYYSLPIPKTLSREWFDEEVVPLFDVKMCPLPDMMRTAVEHIADQIMAAVSHFPRATLSSSGHRMSQTCWQLLATGGGAKNKFLVELLREKLDEHHIEIAECDLDIVDYKEALITAFLGMRTLLGLMNVSKDITGSRMDTVSGSIHLPPNHSKPTLLLK